MGDVHVAMAILCVIAIVLLVIFVLCHSMDLLTYISSWIYSSKEEKMGLTRSKGHYNANGYLVHSDSDIQLGTTGSFKRFDSVDKDFKMTIASTSFTEGDWTRAEYDHSACQHTHYGNGGDRQDSGQQEPKVSYSIRPFSDPGTLLSEQRGYPAKEVSIGDVQPSPELLQETTTSISPIPRPVSSMNMAELVSANTTVDFPNIQPPPPVQPRDTTTQFARTTISKQSSSEVESQQPPKLQPQPSESGSSVASETEDTDATPTAAIKRAISCDSICSDTSVALGDLEEINVTGYLCVGFEYESEMSDLIVNVLEAKGLKATSTAIDNQIDTYVKVFFVLDKETSAQTKVYRSAHSPCYKERFLFAINPREHGQHSLCFHVYCIDRLSHYLIGEGEIRLCDVSLRQPVTTWITLTDSGSLSTELGELMFSLSYLPTAERLTVVVVKARKLKFEQEIGDPFIKVYLMQHGKKIHKKKTSTKKTERCPIFNEAMMFSVPAHSLQTIQLRLTVAEAPKLDSNAKAYSIGHVIVGAQATGKSLSHWNQMLTALRKPVAMWHPLRK